MKSSLGAAIFLVLTASCVHALPETYFSGEGVQNRLLALIQKSQTSIDLAIFEFSSPLLAEALRHAHERGVTVRLLLDSHSGKKDAAEGSMAGLDVRELAGREGHRGLMHDKFAIFDEQLVVTGSYNWTRSAEHSNYENVLIEDDPEVVSKYHRQFSLLWNKASQKHIENSIGYGYVPRRHPRYFIYRRFFWRRKL